MGVKYCMNLEEKQEWKGNCIPESMKEECLRV